MVFDDYGPYVRVLSILDYEVVRYRLSSASVITEDSSGQPLNNLSTTYFTLVRKKANGAKSVQQFQFTQQQLSLQTEVETIGGR